MFYDPVNGQPENIGITKELKQSVRSAHTVYQAHLRTEKLEEERKREEAECQKKETERTRKAQEKMVKFRQSLQDWGGHSDGRGRSGHSRLESS